MAARAVLLVLNVAFQRLLDAEHEIAPALFFRSPCDITMLDRVVGAFFEGAEPAIRSFPRAVCAGHSPHPAGLAAFEIPLAASFFHLESAHEEATG